MKSITYRQSIQEIAFLLILVLGGVLISNAQESAKKRVRVEVEVTEDGETSTTVQEIEIDIDEINAELDDMLDEIEIIIDDAMEDIDDTDLEIVIKKSELGEALEPHIRTVVKALSDEYVWIEESGSNAFLGVVASGLDEEEKEAYNVESGAVISKVVEGSAAEKAGLQEGDVILSIGDDEVSSFGEVAESVRSREPGEEVDIKISRDGKEKIINAELGKRKRKHEHRNHHTYSYSYDVDDEEHRRHKDMRWESLEKEDRAFLGIIGQSDSEDNGVVVTKIFDESTAAEMGLEEGDIIRELNGEEVTDIGDLVDVLNELEPGDELTVKYERDGKSKKVKEELKSARSFKEVLIHTDHSGDRKEIEKYVYRIEIEEIGEDELNELNKANGNRLDVNNSLQTERFTVAPNPSEGVFFLDMKTSSPEDIELIVLDGEGGLVKEQMIRSNEGEVLERIDLLDQPSGMYFISVNQAGKGKVTRLIKQ